MKELDNGLKIYDITELEELKELKYSSLNNKRLGYLYILKYNAKDNVNTIKIGVTINPFSRINELSKTANNYGFSSVEKIAITNPHLNYYKSEKRMHEYYAEKRKPNCEIFNIPFEDACNIVTELLFKESEFGEMVINPNKDKVFEKTSSVDNINIKTETMIGIIKNCKHVSLAVYLSILSHYNKELGYSCMSYNELADETTLSKTTISKYTKGLEKFGYIRITSGRLNTLMIQNSPNVYYLTDMEKGITHE